MSLKSKIEAVIYASEEPVTLQQLTGLLGEEAQAEMDHIAADQALLPLDASGEQKGDTGHTVAGHVVAAKKADLPSVDLDGDGNTAPTTLDSQVPGDVSASVAEAPAAEPTEADKRRARDRERLVREHIRRAVDHLIRDYADSDRGIEIREVASGFRMGTKPEYHDAVRGFVKSLKPALKLTLPALETLAVVAYKQPVTAAEISEIRGVDSAGVLGGLMGRKLIATAGRKQVIGRPMLYKTTRDFLLRFGLKDVQELPSMEEFERMASELVEQEDLPMDHADTLIEQANMRGDAEHIREANALHNAAAENTNEEQHATAEIAEGRETDEHQEVHTSETDARSTEAGAVSHEEQPGSSRNSPAADSPEEHQEAEEAVTAS